MNRNSQTAARSPAARMTHAESIQTPRDAERAFRSRFINGITLACLVLDAQYNVIGHLRLQHDTEAPLPLREIAHHAITHQAVAIAIGIDVTGRPSQTPSAQDLSEFKRAAVTLRQLDLTVVDVHLVDKDTTHSLLSHGFRTLLH